MSENKKTVFGLQPVSDEELEEAASKRAVVAADDDGFGDDDDWDIDEASIRKVSSISTTSSRKSEFSGSQPLTRPQLPAKPPSIKPPSVRPPPSPSKPPAAPDEAGAASASPSPAPPVHAGGTMMLGGADFARALEEAAAEAAGESGEAVAVATAEPATPGLPDRPEVEQDGETQVADMGSPADLGERAQADTGAPEQQEAPAPPVAAGGTMMLGGADFRRALEEAAAENAAEEAAAGSGASAELPAQADAALGSPSEGPAETATGAPGAPDSAGTGDAGADDPLAMPAEVPAETFETAVTDPLRGTAGPAMGPAGGTVLMSMEFTGDSPEDAVVQEQGVRGAPAVPAPAEVPEFQPQTGRMAPTVNEQMAPVDMERVQAASEPTRRDKRDRPVIEYAKPAERPNLMGGGGVPEPTGERNPVLLLVAISLVLLVVVTVAFLMMR